MTAFEIPVQACLMTAAALIGLISGTLVSKCAQRYVDGAEDAVEPSFPNTRNRLRRFCETPGFHQVPSAIVSGLGFALLMYAHGPTFETAELAAFASVLLFLSLTDLALFIIPDGAIAAAIAIRMAFLAASCACGAMALADIGYYAGSAIGTGAFMLAMALATDRLAGRESLGGGDLKLFFVIGLYFGWHRTLFIILTSCLVALVLTRARPDPFPFAPPISATSLLAMLM